MKKNGLTCAVIAGIAGVAGIGSIADAVNLNPDGLGQVLIYPYYTTQAGSDTLFSVVNTSEIAKAVKVRFLEGRNSREVLDFNLYLSPFDVWTAGIFAIPEGEEGFPGAGMFTRDRSCTAPDIVTNAEGQLPDIGGTFYVPFTNAGYADQAADHAAANAGVLGSIERTREGYIELIEMVNIVNAPGEPCASWVTHGPTGVPANCAAVRAAWAAGSFPAACEVEPSGQGQLFGNAMIVNPARGTMTGYAADAIEGFNYTNLHFPPGDAEPSLADVNDPVGANATAFVFEFGSLITATYDNLAPGGFGRLDALSALYASPRVVNEYYLDGNESVQASSEWVITFPTKRFYVDDWPFVINQLGQIAPAFNPNAPVAPFSNAFRGNGSCEPIRVRIWDREERAPGGGGLGFSPPRPGAPQNALCWEAQVVTFGQGARLTAGEPSDILGSTYYNNVTPPAGFNAGWASIEFGSAPGFTPPSMREAIDGEVFRGLPVTGFFVTNYDNGLQDSGVLANYTALFRHRTERDCLVGGLPVCS